ncbi:MAG: hypothetical protein AVDCRST_MAG69-416, partial [uncultured Solirubrobacteraceae bacterium]
WRFSSSSTHDPTGWGPSRSPWPVLPASPSGASERTRGSPGRSGVRDGSPTTWPGSATRWTSPTPTACGRCRTRRPSPPGKPTTRTDRSRTASAASAIAVCSRPPASCCTSRISPGS